jgi:hypothetical protein
VVISSLHQEDVEVLICFLESENIVFAVNFGQSHSDGSSTLGVLYSELVVKITSCLIHYAPPWGHYVLGWFLPCLLVL